MNNKILAFFEIDPDRDRRDKLPLLVSLAVILSMAAARLTASLLFGAAATPGSTLASWIALSVALPCLILVLLRITWPTRILLPVTALAVIDLVLLSSGVGLRSPLILGLPLSILLGGLLLGRKGSILLSTLAITSVAVVGFFAISGAAGSPAPATTLLDVIAGLVFTGAVTAVYAMTMRLLSETIRQARQNENKQIETNEELRQLQASLEIRIEEATKQLRRRSQELSAVAEIARDISAVQSAEQLLPIAVNLVRERFSFYHVGIFLLDDAGDYAVLRAATGDAGRLLLANGHRLRVGEVGIVGYAAASGQARIALDVGSDAHYFRNPLLPYTRSEIALPLVVGGRRVIGALDVQSMQENAFDQEDIEILQILADQLSIAIENSNLIQRLETSLQETGLLYQSQMQDASRAFARRGQTAFEYDRLKIVPAKHDLPAGVLDTLRAGKPATLNSRQLKSLKMDPHIQSLLLVPLLLRDQMIGVIGLERTEDDPEWTPDEIGIAQTIAGQAALTLENARLLEESQQRAAQERALGEISSKISESIRMENILRTAAQELSRVLHGSEVLLQLQSATAESAMADQREQ